ncbi:hypothetical protein [Silvania hatchlandensis]|uniref:DUF2513 domain-containing protein n=1 Tax=Silvania hatchlandensis TaxID=2926469 RepID=A0A9J6Q0I6_9ENTR|nr:hypothetical protein [Silvania hatchlandensis]MCU6666079.1 hypothetical protein [Silvania hatchlandensis]
MDKYNRTAQHELLKELYDRAPYGITQERKPYYMQSFGNIDNLVANLFYLHEHELLECLFRKDLSGKIFVQLEGLKITSKGIDFIRDDGGLGAILNVHSIKFHRDAVVVLEDLIAISNLSDADKHKAKSTLGELSTEALKSVVQTVTTAGLAMLMK